MKRRIAALIIACVMLQGCAQGAAVTAPTQTETERVQYFFTQDEKGEQADEALIKEIDGAKTTLNIAIYYITRPQIVDAILAAYHRGVNVRIITDRESSHGEAEEKALAAIKMAGIPVKVNSHDGLMHLKMTVIDSAVAVGGSYNYTNAATVKNDEMLIVLHDPQIAKDWDSEFDRMWNDDSHFKNR